MKKYFLRSLRAFVFLLISFALMAAIILPFANPNWYYFSFGLLLFMLICGKDVLIWSGKFMEDE